MKSRSVPGRVEEWAWDEACRRDEVVRALVATSDEGRVGRAAIRDAAERLGLSASTLYRLIKRFREERRVSALLPRKEGRPVGTRGISEAVETIIHETIGEIYLVPERPPMRELVRQIAARCRSRGEQPPAERTIKARVQKIDPLKQARLRHDEIAQEAMKATPGKLHVERPLDFVQMDHTQMDIVVVDEETRQFIARPWLTIGIDVFTRMVTGFALSFDPPQRSSVGLCLLHSVFDKSAWLRDLGIEIPWPMAGLPRRIGVDNAAEFQSKDFRSACRDFGIKVEPRPLGKKHFGGHIERLIGTKMGAIQLLPGTTHGSITARQSYDPQDSAVLTMKELEKWLTLQIVCKYHQTIHRSLLRPPIAVWRDWDDKIPFELPANRLAFWISFLPSETRSLQRDGIHLFHIRYWSDALRADVGRTKDPLTVKYDPRDVSHVFVQRANGHWIEARYRDLRRPAISLWEYREALRQLRDQGRREVNEAILFETVIHQREIVAKARKDRASARLAYARQAPSLPPSPESPSRLTGIDLRRESGRMSDKPGRRDE
jgi:putative transposase